MIVMGITFISMNLAMAELQQGSAAVENKTAIHFNTTKGSTQLQSTERLIKTWIQTRHQLNEEEYANIQKAYLKYLSEKIHPKIWFNEQFLVQIHRDMLDETWEWEGV